jgi:hypothetical protein
MSRRVLKRPPQGWANHDPNYALWDMIAFVGVAFGSACFFNWTSMAIDAMLSI